MGKYSTGRAGGALACCLHHDQNQVACSLYPLQPEFGRLGQERLQMAGEGNHLLCQDKTFRIRYVLGTFARSKHHQNCGRTNFRLALTLAPDWGIFDPAEWDFFTRHLTFAPHPF